MPDTNYVRDYFSKQASQWVAGAYGKNMTSGQYPVGSHRVRVSLQAVFDRLGSTDVHLADLGCGGGELCLHAASLGARATGVDVAEGMIKEAQQKRQQLEQGVQERLNFTCADIFQNDLPSESFDAVTAMGLVEYLPDDQYFLEKTFDMLKPGGVLAVSCRNRLFNMASLNEYTQSEFNEGQAGTLMSEVLSLAQEPISNDMLLHFVLKLKEILPNIVQAIEIDLKSKPVPKDVVPFTQTRRQHTPSQLSTSAHHVGFINADFFGIHPHPLPPKLESQAPHFYNQFVRAFEVFEHLDLSLVWSSTFIGLFSKPGK